MFLEWQCGMGNRWSRMTRLLLNGKRASALLMVCGVRPLHDLGLGKTGEVRSGVACTIQVQKNLRASSRPQEPACPAFSVRFLYQTNQSCSLMNEEQRALANEALIFNPWIAIGFFLPPNRVSLEVIRSLDQSRSFLSCSCRHWSR